MDIEVRLSDGTTVRFAGGPDEIEVFTDFVRDTAPGLLRGLAGGSSSGSGSVAGSNLQDRPQDPGLGSAREIHETLERVGASTDIERVAVLAHYANRQGDGLTNELAQQWYSELGLPKPGNWRSTFNNAKNRGYLRPTAEGWKPTTAGENFATHGIRKSFSKRRSARRDDPD